MTAPGGGVKPRGIFIAGNWKMNHGPRETREFFVGLLRARATAGAGGASHGSTATRAAIFPPAVSLAAALEATGASGVAIGAQCVHWEPKGAFTGEISGPLCAELGVKLALVGHSERRQYFGETDATVRKRAAALLAQGFEVMVCVGETRAEREGGQTEAVLERQLRDGLPPAAEWVAPGGASSGGAPRLSIAYEPVWAIGTGKTATPEEAQQVHAVLRAQISAATQNAGRVHILYGGSMNAANAASLLAQPDIDGGLIGGASLKAPDFLQIVASAP